MQRPLHAVHTPPSVLLLLYLPPTLRPRCAAARRRARACSSFPSSLSFICALHLRRRRAHARSSFSPSSLSPLRTAPAPPVSAGLRRAAPAPPRRQQRLPLPRRSRTMVSSPDRTHIGSGPRSESSCVAGVELSWPAAQDLGQLRAPHDRFDDEELGPAGCSRARRCSDFVDVA